jgi:hypothetical protein
MVSTPPHAALGKLVGKIAFTVAESEYRWEDVTAAAQGWPEWDELLHAVREGIACAKFCHETGRKPRRRELTEAAAAFRYSGHLAAAKDMNAWLRKWHLSAEAWMKYIRRSVLRASLGNSVTQLAERYPATQEEVTRSLKMIAVCSGHLDRLAHKLADRAAVFARLSAAAPGEPAAKLSSQPSPGARGLPSLAVLESTFALFRSQVATPQAVQKLVILHHTDWLRIDCDWVGFTSDTAAREAALCVREDGEPLKEVAFRSQTAIEPIQFYLEDVDAGLAASLLSAATGNLFGPIEFRGRPSLLIIREKVLPAANDPQINAKAVELLVHRAVERETAARVEWHK